MSEFTFTEWPSEQLQDRQYEIINLSKTPHGIERKEQLGRELVHITFEIEQRNAKLAELIEERIS